MSEKKQEHYRVGGMVNQPIFDAARVSPTLDALFAEVRTLARDSSFNCRPRSKLRSGRRVVLEASVKVATSRRWMEPWRKGWRVRNNGGERTGVPTEEATRVHFPYCPWQ